MKIYSYGVMFDNCDGQRTIKHGYTIADNEDEAKRKIDDEYEPDKIQIEEVNVIEIN